VLSGARNANRALDGDLVAVEVFSGDSRGSNGEDDKEQEQQQEGADSFQTSSSSVIADITAVPTPASLEGLAENTSSADSAEKYGQVVGVIRRNWRQYAGTVIRYDGHSGPASSSEQSAEANLSEKVEVVDEMSVTASQALFIAVDSKIPPIKITTRRLDELLNQRVLVAIDMWSIDSEYPAGHYIRSLGEDGNKDVETAVLLHEFGVPCEAFSTEVMACLPSKDWKITEAMVAQRTDLRHIPVVSIDPPGCKDIDDALHCVRLPNGNYEVGVHIADVSHFVESESPLDKEAAHRSTSTYLVQRRLDMLPGYLTTELCSLRSKEDHLAFSVIWEVDEEANIIDAKFFKSCIHSVASMTYDEAQAILDAGCPPETGDKDTSTTTKVELSVHFLNRIAKILRQKRIDNGALTLASPEVRFKFEGESDNPTDVSVYNIKDSNQLVEEFMLLANITVSKKVLRHYPTLGVLRRHQPPSQEQFRPLLSAASAVGVTLDISTSKTLADSLDRAVRPEDPFFNKLLRILSTRCMMPAQYFCSGEIPTDQWHHYGLAAPVYTHFTSPIRRYADLVVHRLLAAAIGVTSLPVVNADRSKQQDLCSHMNRRHRAAQHIQRASCGLHTILYFRNRPSVEPAYVLSVLPDRVVVIVPKFGIENTLMVSDIIAEFFPSELKQSGGSVESMVKYDAVAHRMTLSVPGEKTKLLSFQVFQQVLVRIIVQESTGTIAGSSRKIVMKLFRNDEESARGNKKGVEKTPQVPKKRLRDEDNAKKTQSNRTSTKKKKSNTYQNR
jgi:exosome complex exonuclease DIS3/RRP44